VIVTDANGCIATASATITQPVSPILISAIVTNTTCGNANGSIDLTISGGTPPYIITWSNGATTEDLISLAAGNYTVTITDANGCTATTSAIVNIIAGPEIAITASTNVLCFGQSTGSINITVTGGTAPLSYQWSNSAITEDISGLAAGTYTLTVTDANECTVSASVTITQPVSVLSASSSAPPITTTGGSTTVTVTATGGTAPYTGTGTFVRTAGAYTFTVTDANGCSATTTIILTEPSCSITISSTVMSVSCFGGNNGAIDLTVNGASGAVTYSWSNGATTQDLNGLPAGTYTVTVTDKANCTATATITIAQPASALAATATAPAIPCNGTTTTVTVSATGGTAPYTGTGTFIRSPGTYIFSVTDAKGCTASATIVIANAGLLVNAGPDKDLCNGPVTLTAAISGAITSSPPPPATPFNEVSGSTANKRMFAGNIDYITIGNTFSQSEDRNNCNKNSTSSKALTLPAGAVVKKAYLYWSGSGDEDNTVKLNGEIVTAGNTKTYTMGGGFRFFSARANVTNKVSGSGNYTVSSLSWDNGSPYCFANSAYGGWAMTVVYELASLPSARIHINTEKFQYTYPAGNYSTTINNISLPAGCSSNAKLTIVAFEGDNYVGEGLIIGGQNFGDNNFRGQSGPNLDILSWNIPTLVTSATSALTYTINANQSNTVFGPATDGLFDYVKVLKYSICPPACNAVSYQWSTGATSQSITVTQPGSYNVRVTDCSGCIARDTVNVSVCPPVDPDKCYKLIARHSGKALTIEGSSTANGGNAEQRSYNDGNNQKWKFEEIESGYYKVTNVNSGKVLDVSAGSTSNGANIQQWTWNGGDDQRWKLDKNGAGYYGVQAKHSGKYMGVENSSTSNGANVEQRGNNANDNNRQWDISEVGCPNMYTRTTGKIVSKEAEKEFEEPDFVVIVQPNPGSTFFNFTIKSNDKISPVNIRILDVNGRVISVKQKAIANNILRIAADKWANGIYIAEVTQGGQRKIIRLIKSN
jgi:large repetitive protein